MPLLDIPLSGGIDKNTDARVSDRLGEAVNVRYRRRGGLTPRLGTEVLVSYANAAIGAVPPSATPVAPPPPEMLGVLGDHVFACGSGRLHAYGSKFNANTGGQWALVGELPQMVVKRDAIEGTSNRLCNGTLATDGKVTIVVFLAQYDATNSGVYMHVLDAESGAFLKRDVLIRTAGAVSFPRATYSATDGLFAITWYENVATIKGVTVSPTTFAASAAVAIVTTVGNGGHALIARVGGGFLLAYEHNAGPNYRRILSLSSALAVRQNFPIVDATAAATLAFGLYSSADARVWLVYSCTDRASPATVLVRATLVNATTATALSTTLAVTTLRQYTPNSGDAQDRVVLHATALEVSTTEALFGWTILEQEATPVSSRMNSEFCTLTSAGVVAGDSGRWHAYGYVLNTDLWSATLGDGTTRYFAGVIPGTDTAIRDSGIIPKLGNSLILEVRITKDNSTLDEDGTVGVSMARPVATYAVAQTHPYELYASGTAGAFPNERGQCGLSAVITGADGKPRFIGFDRQSGPAPSVMHMVTVTYAYHRQYAKLGGRALISGGTPMLYDGQNCVEWGFLGYPWLYQSSLTAGALTGDYNWQAVWQWVDATGGVMYSAPAPPFSAKVTLAAQQATISVITPHITYKPTGDGMGDDRSLIGYVLFRTAAGPTEPYRRITAVSVPSASSVGSRSARYLDITDNNADTVIASNPQIYTNGGTLSSLPPTSSEFVVAWQGRFVCGGTDDDTIWYSTPTRIGEVQWFNPVLRFDAFEGGRVTGLAVLDDKLVVFKKQSIFIITGEGPADSGQRGTYSRPIAVSTDVGCIEASSIVNTPDGVMFRGRRGIYLLDRGLQVQFIGEPVATYTEDTTLRVRTAWLTPDRQVACFALEDGTTDQSGRALGTVLVYDYLNRAWTTDLMKSQTTPPVPVASALGADGRLYWSDSLGQLYRENTNYEDGTTGETVTYKFRTAFVKPAGLQGEFKALRVAILGEYGAPHVLTVNVYVDYQDTSDPGLAKSTATWNVTAAPAKGYQFVHGIAGGTQRVESVAIEVIVSDYAPSALVADPPAIISGIALEYEIEKDAGKMLFSALPPEQRG